MRWGHLGMVTLLGLMVLLSLVSCLDTGEKAAIPGSGTIGSGIADHAVGSSPDGASPSPIPTTSPSAGFSVVDLSNAIADIVERVQPAVVFISAKVETQSFFFNQKAIETNSGSGVIISPEGYILTNNHVIADAIEVQVTVPGKIEPYKAEIIGQDPLTDLAVIKISGKNLPTVAFGNASALRPGNLVIALGYPLALEHGASVTLGVVSNTERSFTLDESAYYDVIQTDAAINPGNSGGPLINLNGEIVGINSVMAGMAQNIGFAISANTARAVYEALVGPGHRVVRPWLGVVLATVTPDLAEEAELTPQRGVVIKSIEEGSPADKAGLKVRDVITRIDGKDVYEATQLIKELWRHQVGDEVTLTYWRNGKEAEVTIKLSVERPD